MKDKHIIREEQEGKHAISEDQRRLIGDRILAIRGERTQEQFAEEIGVDRATVGTWERGTRPINLTNLLCICNKFNCDADYILGRLNEKTHDIKEISDLTGLSPIVVEMLIKNTQEKEKRLEEYRKNDEPLNDWYYQDNVTSAQIREYLINALLTDDELWKVLLENACLAADGMIDYLSQKSGNRLLPAGVEDATPYMISESQRTRDKNGIRLAVSDAFNAFWNRLCRSPSFIKKGFPPEMVVPDKKQRYNNIIAYGLKEKILHK